MSDMRAPVSALGGAVSKGFAEVREIGPLGMITLRAKPDAKGLAKAVKAAVGTELPALRRIVAEGDRACGWMSPDEYLLVLPYAAVPAALDAIGKAMAGVHHLAVDVSDARAVFRVEGAKADQVLAKLRAYQAEGIEAFILSGYPHINECDMFARYVLPRLEHGRLEI